MNHTYSFAIPATGTLHMGKNVCERRRTMRNPAITRLTACGLAHYTSAMELFPTRSIPGLPVAECAALVVAAVPAVMQALRREMRASRPAELSLSQFRALIYLRFHAGASVSDVAEHLGLALSSTSQLIDALVKEGYITRETAKGDRRRATLALTSHGATMLDAIRARAQARMEERLAVLTADERQAVGIAMQALQRVFGAHAAGSIPGGDTDPIACNR
ncbi:MAG: DNA-binding transcriptional repressor MarR [bacterium ADurb.Bin429]|nr:MAG: DNA-binding transcriptional repressor MarR [bacterium ADurb.Bin429]